MYKFFIRPLLFLFPPETLHKWVTLSLKLLFGIPGSTWLARKIYLIEHPLLERELFGIRFPNPVGIAAGFDKEGTLYKHLSNFGFGYIEVGTVTPLGQTGNPKPRLFRLPGDQALINRMGFNNHGVYDMVEKLRKNNTRVIIGGNIGKNTLTPNEMAIDDYCHCFKVLFDHVDYFVVNVSCPNIEGLSKLQDKDELVSILNAIQKINREKPLQKPVLLKISPDLNDKQLDEVIDMVRITGLSGIIATNTSTKRDGLITDVETIQKIGKGGLSGKPLQKKSTDTIAYIHKHSGGTIPIIASGGIFTGSDAVETLKAGAALLQVYTGFVYEGPSIAKNINKAIIHNR